MLTYLKKNIYGVGILLLAIISIDAQVQYIHKPILNNPWQADSLFLGAELIVMDSSQNIIVLLKNSSRPYALGKLFFMVPNQHDSAIFLFHNDLLKYPNEPTTVNIGRYSAGTRIVLMFEFSDTRRAYKYFLGKKLYSGKNRLGIDEYSSSLTSIYKNNQLAVVGKMDGNKAEVGFSDAKNGEFTNIIVEVSNVVVEK